MSTDPFRRDVGELDTPLVPLAAINARAELARLVRNTLDANLANVLADKRVIAAMLEPLAEVDTLQPDEGVPLELDSARYLFARIRQAAADAEAAALALIEAWFAAREVEVVS